MLTIKYTSKMKRDVKRLVKRGKDMSKLIVTLALLASQTQMPEQYKDHPLKGDMAGFRECHIEGDWLLVYKIEDNELRLLAAGSGTHSDLFGE